jgi:hypothetical protein
MAIARCEFVGFSVVGPGKRTFQAYKPSDWVNWTATAEGPSIIFEGEKRRIEVPRARCVVYSDLPQGEPAPKGKKL